MEHKNLENTKQDRDSKNSPIYNALLNKIQNTQSQKLQKFRLNKAFENLINSVPKGTIYISNEVEYLANTIYNKLEMLSEICKDTTPLTAMFGGRCKLFINFIKDTDETWYSIIKEAVELNILSSITGMQNRKGMISNHDFNRLIKLCTPKGEEQPDMALLKSITSMQTGRGMISEDNLTILEDLCKVNGTFDVLTLKYIMKIQTNYNKIKQLESNSQKYQEICREVERHDPRLHQVLLKINDVVKEGSEEYASLSQKKLFYVILEVYKKHIMNQKSIPSNEVNQNTQSLQENQNASLFPFNKETEHYVQDSDIFFNNNQGNLNTENLNIQDSKQYLPNNLPGNSVDDDINNPDNILSMFYSPVSPLSLDYLKIAQQQAQQQAQKANFLQKRPANQLDSQEFDVNSDSENIDFNTKKKQKSAQLYRPTMEIEISEEKSEKKQDRDSKNSQIYNALLDKIQNTQSQKLQKFRLNKAFENLINLVPKSTIYNSNEVEDLTDKIYNKLEMLSEICKDTTPLTAMFNRKVKLFINFIKDTDETWYSIIKEAIELNILSSITSMQSGKGMISNHDFNRLKKLCTEGEELDMALLQSITRMQNGKGMISEDNLTILEDLCNVDGTFDILTLKYIMKIRTNCIKIRELGSNSQICQEIKRHNPRLHRVLLKINDMANDPSRPQKSLFYMILEVYKKHIMNQKSIPSNEVNQNTQSLQENQNVSFFPFNKETEHYVQDSDIFFNNNQEYNLNTENLNIQDSKQYLPNNLPGNSVDDVDGGNIFTGNHNIFGDDLDLSRSSDFFNNPNNTLGLRQKLDMLPLSPNIEIDVPGNILDVFNPDKKNVLD